MHPRALCLSLSLCLCLGAGGPAQAWGALGHRIIGEVAARNFPKTVPAFLRTPDAVAAIGEFAREPDRSRDAGNPHDADLDPGHFVDLSDDGTVLGGPRLDALPASRLEFDTALRAAGANQDKAGWLPYSIIDGYQQLVKDFSLWRADVAGAKFAKSAADRKWLQQDRKRREMLTLRDLGMWAHFVGDGSQPLHVSVHYNGWGDFPNPNNFAGKNLHARFETDFINANIREKDVAGLIGSARPTEGAIRDRTIRYLLGTAMHVETTYRLDQAQAFETATPEARQFAIARLADGAMMLRDLVASAWAESADTALGYGAHKLPLADVEAGKASPLSQLRD
ncbi:MAG: S1/P1 Nuclease [Rhizomicrobium sp.]